MSLMNGIADQDDYLDSQILMALLLPLATRFEMWSEKKSMDSQTNQIKMLVNKSKYFNHVLFTQKFSPKFSPTINLPIKSLQTTHYKLFKKQSSPTIKSSQMNFLSLSLMN